jgi:four helix bundle protein
VRSATRQTADCQTSDVRDKKSEASGAGGEANGRVCTNRTDKLRKGFGRVKAAYDLAMKIFESSKRFPIEEKFALTSQIRRSSRSVCLNLREAWAKRRYEAHFVSKLTDSDGENSETDSSLDFAKDCEYISTDEHRALTSKCAEIGRMLSGMMKKSSSFLSHD